jgi:hypothetical protein
MAELGISSVEPNIEISRPHYGLLVKYCNVFSRGYMILKGGVTIRRHRKDGSAERVVVIRRSEDEARLLVDLAKSACPDAVPAMEKAIGVLRES